MRDLGRRVRQLRTKAGVSQTALADAVGRSHAWVSDLENGKAGAIPAEVITALAVELGQEPADFLRLAGRAVLKAEDLVPVRQLDTAVLAAIERAVDRASERLGDRLEGLLRELLAGGAR